MVKTITSESDPLNRWMHITFFSVLIWGMIIVRAAAAGQTDTVNAGPDLKDRESIEQNSWTPHPDLGPADVVRIQIEALANNNDPYQDAGIEISFRFASPSNQQVTGPLSRFTRMLYNPLYSPMLEHQKATYGELFREDGQAMQKVILKAADGRQVGYLFVLSKQSTGPFEECWMTDGVLRFKVNAV
jgi:hypothetical protein